MKPEIAWALMQVASQRQSREFTAWRESKSEKAGESHRLACAAWAQAVNELYAIARPTPQREMVETGGTIS